MAKGITLNCEDVLDNIIELANRVTAYDWSDNDDDAVSAIEDLRRYIEIIKSIEELSDE